MSDLVIRPVTTKADKKRFVDLAWDVYQDDPAWVPPLKSEVMGLITPGENPWFEHGEAALWLAERGGRPVGRISAQIDRLVLEHMGEGTGNWGMFEVLDSEKEAGPALIATAEDWLRARGMTRALGPISLSIWDEPGLEIKGFTDPPTAMMGHHRPAYEAQVEAAGYAKAKDLYCYALDIRVPLEPLAQRLIQAGKRSSRIRIREVDKSRFDEEAAIILNLLNDAWSDNWGFVPLTESEIAYAGKKLKPIIFEDLVVVAEVDGEPAGFMITIPDINELTRDLNGRLFPFGWAKLLWRLRKPRVHRMRVPLMGVAKKHQGGRLAGQLAFMMIEYCRQNSVDNYGASHGEFGWVLEDNGGMLAIADLRGSERSKIYRIYEKAL
ncbi:GNAT superfamily N-acetyltransferase [Sphingomonas kaistensis]|uniref:GNAT superfamily N-acetyltransferase n=1 Tax=Sphingomonas kaistensis TaxID=298708 RepID=A0A7X5Y7G0_9SPHN|nr:N-acetyltransferase [Sphingomonas kaistensis]NJC05290.1 GNAT superfamily N-acetyltransferase [Sphingomonas kaistensis]